MKNFIYLLLFPLFAFGRINGPADYQIWQRTILTAKMAHQWDFLLTEETRFGDNITKFYYTYLQANFSYIANQWVTLSPGYRQVYKRSPLSSTQWRPEYSPMIDIYFNWKKNNWKFSDRSRIQYLIFESNPDHWVYRNQLRITTPWKVTSFEANPYIEEEVFFRQNQGFVENRVTFGFSEQMTKHVVMDFFYIARYLKNSPSWVYNNIFGFNLKLNY